MSIGEKAIDALKTIIVKVFWFTCILTCTICAGLYYYLGNNDFAFGFALGSVLSMVNFFKLKL